MNKKTLYTVVFFFLLSIFIGIQYLNTRWVSVNETNEGIFVFAAGTARLQEFFNEKKYNMLSHIEGEVPVPRLFVRSVPKDFNKEKFDGVRPALFFEMLYPLILKANEEVEKHRGEIKILEKEFYDTGRLTEASRNKLNEWLVFYDVPESEDLSALFHRLLLRADTIAPTLLLSMAAQDSGFGTSRYAREYNALFNQQDWNGNGAVPDEKQKEGPQYRIKTFPSLYDAVVSQIHYLNTYRTFENFRTARAKYRQTKQEIRGLALTYLLVNFPFKPIKYPDIIKYLILQYELTPLDSRILEPIKNTAK